MSDTSFQIFKTLSIAWDLLPGQRAFSITLIFEGTHPK